MILNITTSTWKAQAHPYGRPAGEPPGVSMGWVLPTAAKLQNVSDMTKYRASNELSMTLVKRITFLTFRVNIVYIFYILL